jgi:uncharacterized protein YecE (DUF72 family)
MAHGQLELFGAPEESARARPAARRTVEAAAVASGLAEIARVMPPEVRFGTSSWAFPGWEGIVYDGGAPKGRLSRDGLAAYARHPLLRAVGLDRTYYAPIAADEYARYAAQVPEGFRFLVKAPRDCTWRTAPAAGAAANPRFLDPAFAADAVVGPAVEGLGGKLGTILFQFPPTDLGAVGGPSGFARRLASFLERLPRGPLYSVEIRTADALGAEYREALAAAGACPCLNVHPTMPDVEEQAEGFGWLGSRAGTPPALVVRWMLGRNLGYDQARDRYDPFDRIVDEDPRSRDAIAGLAALADRAGKPVLVIANNKAEGSAPLTVFRLAERVARLWR